VEKVQACVAKALQDLRAKLLDLSKRNRLLNFRHNRYCVKIVNEQPNQVFSYLVRDGKSMTFAPLPQPDEPEGDEEKTLAADSVGIEIAEKLPSPEAHDGPTPQKHKDNKLQTTLFMEDLEPRLRRIRSKANSVIQETNKNQLFLAMGFLQWKDHPDSEGVYEAPLVMIPVELERGSLEAQTRCYTYKLKYTGEDLIPNLSLAEKLKADGIELPKFEDEDVVTDVNGNKELEPEAYFEALSKAVVNLKGWEVNRKIILGFFTFSKLLMYHDLDEKKWPEKSILSHSLITTLFGCDYDSGTGDESGDTKEKITVENLRLVVDSDSSQTEAISKAMNGQSIVIQGPPGTGKSQTITNLIACFLNEGKSVLFVAEKMAALNVVYRNLEKVDLADFCLELHSYKGKKKEVLASLERRYQRKFGNVAHLESEIERLEEAQKSPSEYVELIKKPIGPNEETIFQIFGKVEILRNKLEQPASLPINNVDRITNGEIQEATNLLGELARFIGDLGLPCENPWYGYEPIELVYGDDREVTESLDSAKEATASVADGLSKLASEIQLSISASELSLVQLKAICTFGQQAVPTNLMHDLAGHFLSSQDGKPWDVLTSLKSVIAEYNENIRLSLEVLEEPEQIPPERLTEIDELLSDVQKEGLRSTTLQGAKEVGASCLRLCALVEQFQAAVKKHLASGFPEPRSISDIRRLAEIDSLIRGKPHSIQPDMIERILEDSIRIVFAEAIETGLYLKAEEDYLRKTFVLQDVCDIQKLSEVRRSFRFFQGKFFAFLSPEYIRAKRALFRFLRIRLKAKSPKILEDLERLEEFLSKKKEFINDARYKEAFGDLFKGIDTNWDSLRELAIWATNLCDSTESNSLAKELARLPQDVTDCWATRDELEQTLISIEREIEACTSALEYANHSRDDPTLETMPLDTLLSKLSDLGTMLTSIYESVSPLVRTTESMLTEVAEAITFSKAAARLRKEVDSAKEFKLLLGPHFRGVNTDVDGIGETADWFHSIKQLNLPCELVKKIVNTDARTLIASIQQYTQQWKPDLELIESSIESLGKFGEVDVIRFLGVSIDECLIGEIDHKIEQALTHIDHLSQWAEFCRLTHRGREMGLDTLIDLVEKGELAAEQAADTYLYTIYNSLAKKLLRENPILSTFSRVEYESKRERFAELDKNILKLFQQEIAYNASRKPVPEGTRGSRVRDLTDMWLLKREFNKERRHLAIRRLLERAGDAIKALKPIFMMSPMSVAQFLEPGKHTFDVVIMDEASQIQPHDALGAIARAKQMIIVGDSKQLPPTTFFQAEMSNPEDDDQEETIFNELDAATSILDICQSTNYLTRCLKWHYRSEHESLIAFSNLQWYGNELILFPSSGSSPHKLGIQFHFIEGATYATGRNKVEARYVAQKIIQHARKSPELSLGVGTFNLKQRELIEDCLAQLLKEDPTAESSINKLDKAHEGTEPLFIKNLENLQGDERDVIFISYTFGPDKETGQVYQRFGPINSANGPRRLNVLFTRAKKRMEVFSSLKPEDILVEPGSEGRVALKGFLKYAMTGELPYIDVSTNRPPDSDFEIAVGRVLTNMGYKIQPQVGVAGYFVDIGVRSPNRSDEYILGIECDGATYHSSASARDRDRLREEVLKQRGWRIHRIWSTDWFKNRTIEIERLNKRLQQLVEEDKHVIREVEELLDVKSSPVPEAETRLSDKELRSRITTFCLENIPRFEEMQRMDGFLNVELLDILVTYRPTNMSDFRTYVPTDIRANLNNDDVQYIYDIFDIIEQAG